MSLESIVYGYIKGATLRPGPHFFDLHPLNRAVINRLPRGDEWPFLTRSMFAYPGDDAPAGRFRRQIIHLGASFKQVEEAWEEWLGKFEALLRRLYWWSVTLHLESQQVGNYTYLWAARSPEYGNDDRPLPTTES